MAFLWLHRDRTAEDMPGKGECGDGIQQRAAGWSQTHGRSRGLMLYQLSTQATTLTEFVVKGKTCSVVLYYVPARSTYNISACIYKIDLFW